MEEAQGDFRPEGKHLPLVADDCDRGLRDLQGPGHVFRPLPGS